MARNAAMGKNLTVKYLRRKNERCCREYAISPIFAGLVATGEVAFSCIATFSTFTSVAITVKRKKEKNSGPYCSYFIIGMSFSAYPSTARYNYVRKVETFYALVARCQRDYTDFN